MYNVVLFLVPAMRVNEDREQQKKMVYDYIYSKSLAFAYLV